MVRTAPLDRSHLHQTLALVNSHLGTLIPGWSLTPDYFWERLKSNPEEYVVDPWVVERKSIVGIVRDRVCAAVHLLRYGDDTRWSGVGEIAWILFLPKEREAGAAVLSECRRQIKAWQVTKEQISVSLPVPVCVGIPDVWPHIGGLMEQCGYSANDDIDESVYGGSLEGISGPDGPPIEGATIQREVGISVLDSSPGWRDATSPAVNVSQTSPQAASCLRLPDGPSSRSWKPAILCAIGEWVHGLSVTQLNGCGWQAASGL